MFWKKMNKFFNKPDKQSQADETKSNCEAHSLDSPNNVYQLKQKASKRADQKETELLNEANRAAALENRKLLEKVTGTSDAALQSIRAQVLYTIGELERKLGALDGERDELFLDKVCVQIIDLTELKIFDLAD